MNRLKIPRIQQQQTAYEQIKHIFLLYKSDFVDSEFVLSCPLHGGVDNHREEDFNPPKIPDFSRLD